MEKVTILFAVALIGLGLVGYYGSPPKLADENVAAEPAESEPAKSEPASNENSDKPSVGKKPVTALIPAFVGGVLLLLGLIGFVPAARKHAMHVAAMVGLVAFLAGGYQLASSLGKALSAEGNFNGRSTIFVALMTLICAFFVAACVNSFRQARRIRLEELAMQKRSTEDAGDQPNPAS